MEHGLRYERMEEFIDVCRALWDSAAPDAFSWDRETGIVADPAKVHAINHAGKFFKVRGPLNCMPSPQRHRHNRSFRYRPQSPPHHLSSHQTDQSHHKTQS